MLSHETARTGKDASRLRHLDGLRTVATALVVLFHAYVRWPNLVPYGNKYATTPIISSGMLGVELFFMISGFVILMTLQKCKGFREFIWKRWLRLFPAILICSTIIYCTGHLLTNRPTGTPTLTSLISGLLLIDPYWIKMITGLKLPLAEGAMWSLFVEVQFYFVFGIGFFIFGGVRITFYSLGIFFLSHAVTLLNANYNPTPDPLAHLIYVLGTEYYGWFASGAFMYLFWTTGLRHYLLMAVVAGISSSLTLPTQDQILVGLTLVALFIASITNRYVQSVLALPVLASIGPATYPIYLMHENMTVSLIIQQRASGLPIPDAMLPVLPIALVIVVCWVIAYHLEPRVRKAIVAGVDSTKRRMSMKLDSELS